MGTDKLRRKPAPEWEQKILRKLFGGVNESGVWRIRKKAELR